MDVDYDMRLFVDRINQYAPAAVHGINPTHKIQAGMWYG
jgi:hypothetical protein